MPQQDITIAALQSSLEWEAPEKNFAKFHSEILSLSTPVDLVVLPEMFTTGFSMNVSAINEKHLEEALEWMLNLSKRVDAAICGSIACKVGKEYFNRLLWVEPNDNFYYYDKRHLFSLSDEPKLFSKGEKKIIVNYKGWNFLPLICYDLRFPVWSRNTIRNNQPEYDVLIYVANWPDRRAHAWQSLLVARAIENQSFVIGVNRVGEDGNAVSHSGDSIIIDPLGIVVQHVSDEPQAIITKLSANHLNKVRHTLPFLHDADNFEIKLN